MARYNYPDDINKELRRIVKNFNEKRGRDIKLRGRGIIPERKYVREIKMRFAGKPISALRREMKAIEAYNKMGRLAIEKPFEESPISNWELSYMIGNIPEALEIYNKDIEELENILSDKPEYFVRHHDRLNTLKAQRDKLASFDESNLNELDVKAIRRYIENTQRSDITKERDFRTFLSQLERTMEITGYSKAEIDKLYDKFMQLSPNEFLELYRREEIIERIYETVDSPKGKGDYQLMTTSKKARERIDSLINRIDGMISNIKQHD